MQPLLAGIFLLAVQNAQDPHVHVARNFDKPDAIDPALLQAAVSSTAFGPRYAALVARIHRYLAGGTGGELLYRDIHALGKAEPKAKEHLAALAESFKKAIYCTSCKNGKVDCGACGGKGKADRPCPDCNGLGHKVAPGARQGAKPVQRCNTCNAQGVFKNAGCGGCGKTGKVDCSACLGRPWRERRCPADCTVGRVDCSACKGTRFLSETCTACGGKGYVQASGARLGKRVDVKCRGCEGTGISRTDKPCPTCAGSVYGPGKVECDACKGGKEPGPPVAQASDILGRDSCDACGGQGWPDGKACAKCRGLGALIRPASDPSKTLE